MALNYQILKGYIDKADKIIVGVSGGADSMCLLDLILKFSKEQEFDFYAVHINHNIRNDEAKRDENFVRDFCLKNQINFEVIKVDAKSYSKEQNKTLEQGARELRYNALFEFQKSIKANKIFVAHHMTDQAETVLMHILRGSSLSGAKGMADKGLVYRPLLSFTREDILEYTKKNKIKYVEDSTNDDISYSRNFVRKEILPKFEQVYPNSVKAIFNFAEKCRVDDEFIESMIPLDLLEEEQDQVIIDSKVKKLHFALSLRLIKKAFERIGVLADIENKHLIQVLELFDKKNGSKINFPHKLIAYKEYEKVVITKENKSLEKSEYAFSFSDINFENFGLIKVEPINNNENVVFSKNTHYIDYDMLPKGAVWRTQKQGDSFKKLGGGTKKLCDYYTDKKIAKRIRKNVPVLALNDKVFVVAGQDISDEVKLTEKTSRVVKISYII